MTGESVDDGVPVRETVTDVLADHPVRVGLLFGSRARAEGHESSDVDVAVVFEDLEPGDPRYNDALFGLGADLAVALGTDDVDVVDLRRASPALVRTVFAEGTVLVGDEHDVAELRERLLATADEDDPRSPAERFDDVLTAIDDHLA
jgi:predicted nucleotidyltransferase